MTETNKSSASIRALVDRSIREGNGFDAELHADDPTLFEMTKPMSDAVRRAGEWDQALSYMQTIGREVPREGFIDEAAEMIVSFPFPPEVLAAAQAQLQPTMTWRTLSAVIAGLIGIAVVGRAVIDRPFESFNVAVGVFFLGLALILYRWGKRR